MKRIINVSNRLPIKIDKKGNNITKSSGGLVTALEGVRSDYDLLWVGWTGNIFTKDSGNSDLEKRIYREFKYVGINLNSTEVENFYNGFSNTSLWPLLHYIVAYFKDNKKWWESYCTVNKKYAEKVVEYAKEGDIIWVHDYHLMLLPTLLREKIKNVKIGFFLHTPFPSYEIFRCHPNRESLIKGMLGADLIGFHTFGYLRHFRSTVLRILGYESEIYTIPHDGNQTKIGFFPIGISWNNFETTFKTEAYQASLEKYKNLFQNKKVVLSVERMDYTKGIPEKIASIEYLLKKYNEYRNSLVFIIIAIPSRESVHEYKRLNKSVALSIGRINGQYSSLENIPIHYINRSLPFPELCALYTLAEVCTVTPLIDGMNLVAKEYIACQVESPGVLILSEFAGAAQELGLTITVNPFDIVDVADSIHRALNMKESEKLDILSVLRERIIKYNSSYWAKNFIEELNMVNYRLMKSERYKTANQELIKQFIDSPKKKGIFLDYDGTLVDFKKDAQKAIPDAELKIILANLSQKIEIDFFIISGRNGEFLEKHFSNYSFHLIAEHGFLYKTKNSQWKVLIDSVDLSWKEEVERVFDHYALVTPGSYVEVKKSAIVWHYRSADPEFGSWKANELINELSSIITNMPAELHHGKKIVEVCSIQVNKGKALKNMMQRMNIEKALCIGDDQTDETMFRLNNVNLLKIKVGLEDTSADYRVGDVSAVRDLLKIV